MSQEYIFSVLVVEDESSSLDLLIDFISSHNRLKLSGISRNGNDALEKIKTGQFDIIFLDNMLPGKSGMNILKELEVFPVIIFTTAYKEPAIEAFDIGVTDYLLKPYSKERFQKSVDRAISKIKANKKNKQSINTIGMFFKTKTNRLFINFDQILFITAIGKHCLIQQKFLTTEVIYMIGELEEKLPKSIFNRIHRKFIVNLKFVKYIELEVGGKQTLYLNDEKNTSLPVGRKYIEELKDS